MSINTFSRLSDKKNLDASSRKTEVPDSPQTPEEKKSYIEGNFGALDELVKDLIPIGPDGISRVEFTTFEGKNCIVTRNSEPISVDELGDMKPIASCITLYENIKLSPGSYKTLRKISFAKDTEGKYWFKDNILQGIFRPVTGENLSYNAFTHIKKVIENEDLRLKLQEESEKALKSLQGVTGKD